MPYKKPIYVNGRKYESMRAYVREQGLTGHEERLLRRAIRDRQPFRGLRVACVYEDRKLLHKDNLDMRRRIELRERILDENSVCAKCGLAGRDFLEVDHIKPLADGGTDDDANLQPLCKPCHAAKTISENVKRASKPKPVTIRGKEYSSIHAASRALGVDRSVIKNSMRQGTLDKVGLSRLGSLAGVTLMRPVNIEGILYKSRNAAAFALGMCEKAIARRIASAHSAWCLMTFNETWRWRSIEHKIVLEAKDVCSFCGDRALRAAHREVNVNLRRNPFKLPVLPLCIKCERQLRHERRPVLKAANLELARKLIAKEAK